MKYLNFDRPGVIGSGLMNLDYGNHDLLEADTAVNIALARSLERESA